MPGDLGWLCGVFDVRGTVEVLRIEGAYRVSHSIGLALRSQDPRLVYPFQEAFGGRVRLCGPTDPKKSWHRWLLKGPGVPAATEMLLRGCVVKAELLGLVREFHSRLGPRYPGQLWVTRDVFLAREDLTERIHALIGRAPFRRYEWPEGADFPILGETNS